MLCCTFSLLFLCAAEYQSGSSVFLAKIRKLEAMYASIRRARGDGNCFFRSFIFAYMEHLVFTADLTERNRYIQACYLFPTPTSEWLDTFWVRHSMAAMTCMTVFSSIAHTTKLYVCTFASPCITCYGPASLIESNTLHIHIRVMQIRSYVVLLV